MHIYFLNSNYILFIYPWYAKEYLSTLLYAERYLRDLSLIFIVSFIDNDQTRNDSPCFTQDAPESIQSINFSWFHRQRNS